MLKALSKFTSQFFGPLFPVLHWLVLGLMTAYTEIPKVLIFFSTVLVLVWTRWGALSKARSDFAILFVYLLLISHSAMVPFQQSFSTFIYMILALQASHSLILKKPFTIEYAKTITHESQWNDIHFYYINVHISAFWVVIFLQCSLITLLVSPQFKSALIALLLIAGSLLSSFYPNYYAKSKGLV